MRSRRSSAPSSDFSSGAYGGPVVVAEVRVARAAGDDEGVVVERQVAAVRQAAHRHPPRVQVEAVDLAEHDARVSLAAQDLPQGHRDLDRRERAGRDLVGERLEEIEVLPVDERHLDRGAPEAADCEQPAEASSDDDDLLHLRTECRAFELQAGAASRRGRPRSR